MSRVDTRAQRRRIARRLVAEALEGRQLLSVNSDSVYSLLNGRTVADQQAFYVYQDADSGFNHGSPSGKFASGNNDPHVLDKMEIDPAAVDDPNSPSGVTTDPTRLDATHGNVLRVTFQPLDTNEYVGFHFEDPQGWVSNHTGLGYDLRGATQVAFDVRSPGGISVQFGVADHPDSYMTIPPSATYTTKTISLSSLGLSSSDLSNVHLLFSIATDHDHASQGGTLLLDNIRFLPEPASQQGQLSFPLANQTFGVVPVSQVQPGRIPVPVDQLLRNLTTVYESSLTGIALLNRHGTDDLMAARIISDAFDTALHHDNHGDPVPSAPDGSVGLHNSYSSGDLTLLNAQPPQQGQSQQGDARLAGFTCSMISPNGYCLLLDGATGGNNAFAILELTAAYAEFQDPKYLNDAEMIGNWITGYLADMSGAGYGGYYNGYPDIGDVPQGQPRTLNRGKSVENNADIFAAFSALAQVDPAHATLWAARAKVAGDFVMAMFDPANGRFYAGTVLPGVAGAGIDPTGPRRGNDVINQFDFLDSNSFTTLALASSPLYRDQIDWRLPVRYLLSHFAQTVTAGGVTYQGFNLVTQPTAGPNGIAWEFTGQFVELARFVDRLYATSEFEDAAQFYLGQIGQAQASAPFGDGRGVVAATVQGGDVLPPYQQALSTPFQNIPERVGLGASNWALFAALNVNPLQPPGPVIGHPFALIRASRVRNRHGKVTNVDVFFNDPVDPLTARRRRNYLLTLAGSDGIFGTRDDVTAVPTRVVRRGSSLRLTFARKILLRLARQDARLGVAVVKDVMGRTILPSWVPIT
jgi:hypothetical protein